MWRSIFSYHCALTDTYSSLWVIRTDTSWSWDERCTKPGQFCYNTCSTSPPAETVLFSLCVSCLTPDCAQWADWTRLLLSNNMQLCFWGAYLPKFVKASGLKGGKDQKDRLPINDIHGIIPYLEALIKCLPCAKVYRPIPSLRDLKGTQSLLLLFQELLFQGQSFSLAHNQSPNSIDFLSKTSLDMSFVLFNVGLASAQALFFHTQITVTSV